MKYNEKYDLYIDDDYVIYYWDKKLDKLMQRPLHDNGHGYLVVATKLGNRYVHRVIYETFVGPIPDGYEIDHVKGNKTDNRPEMLKCVTHKENMNNSLTLSLQSESHKGKKLSEETKRKMSESLKGNTNAKGHRGALGKPKSEFGRKFKEYYGITKYQNDKLYHKEIEWYRRHGKCRWE